MQCVVETGNPILVAIVKKSEDPMRAQSIPSIKTLGLPSKASTAIIPDLIVPDTREL